MGRKIIYSRVSTDKQEAEAQLMELRERYPNADVYKEIAGGTKKRPVLDALMHTDGLQENDTLIVYSLDRIGRSVLDVIKRLESLDERGVNVIFLKENIDYSTPVGRLMAGILASVAQMERDRIIERTKYGIRHARENGTKSGKSIGRPSTITQEQKDEAIRLVSKGVRIAEVAKSTGMSVSYVRSLLRKK